MNSVITNYLFCCYRWENTSGGHC